MIKIRKSNERGAVKIDWLDSKHTFSFGDYYDPQYMGFGVLRVINEDIVIAGGGFATHPHRDMEIITYILEGELEHKDSLGTGSIIRPQDAQRMSAGTGILHSEFNPQPDKQVHLLQIWILPEKKGISPRYEQKDFSEKRKAGGLCLLASKNGREGSLTINQDADLYVIDLAKGNSYNYQIKPTRMLWVQIAKGTATLNSEALQQGDGAAITNETTVNFIASEKTEILLFDLPNS